MRASRVELHGLLVDFDGFKAIDGVDLTVEPGELRFLIGPNGAGKTTLIDVITGLTRAAEGSVLVDGTDVTGMAPHQIVRLGVGRSFQTPTVFEALTVVENLDMAASFRMRMIRQFRRRPGVSTRVTEILGQIGLTAAAERPAGVLSHGQRQWLEIGMLLIQDPRLLLLDEPVAGMSQAERVATGELLESMAGERTVIVVEHDMAFLRRFASAVTVLHEGTVIAEGSVDHIRGHPAVQEVYLGRSRDARSGIADHDDAPAVDDAAAGASA